ncbi:peptidoglycan binding domain-containing protein, partial [Streptomyces sp. NPDC006129]
MRPRTASVPRITSLPPLALACGALVVGAGGLYLAGLVLTGGEIDSGTTVRGVEIGGLSRAEAVRKLERRLGAAGARELTVKVGDRTGTVDPRRAGLSYDIQETVDRAARTGNDPVGVFEGFFRSGGAVEPVVRLDEGKARAALGQLAKDLDQKVREGAVGFDGGRVKQVAPRTGYALDVDAAVAPLRASFLRGDAAAVTALPARES